jgi:predicted nucleic acid-binding protein
VTSFVLDASVAAKWMLPAKNEPLRTEAYQVLDGYAATEFELLVPDVFWAECGNILWKAVRQSRLSRADAEEALSSMLLRDFPTFASAKLLPEALPIAFNYGRAVYDCLYVALAVQSGAQLLTADERLANALAAHLPVKWLGGLSLSGQA